MKITDATNEWQSVTTESDEVWQPRIGHIEVDTDSTAAERAGILLNSGSSIQIGAGVTVYNRLHNCSNAIISRVAVSV